MSSQKHPAATQPGHPCPACGHPLPTTIERHKTMGIYTPHYTTAPCTNPTCPTNTPNTPPHNNTENTPTTPDNPTNHH